MFLGGKSMETKKVCPSCGRVNDNPGWNCAVCGARMGGDLGKEIFLKKEEPEPFALWEERTKRENGD